MHATKRDDAKRKKPKTMTPFPKWNIDMTIQSQVLSMYALTCLLYMLQHIGKKHHQRIFFCSKTPKTQVESFTHNVLLVAANQDCSFKSAKNLGSSAKVSVLAKSITPCIDSLIVCGVMITMLDIYKVSCFWRYSGDNTLCSDKV